MLGNIKKLWNLIFQKKGGNSLFVIFPYWLHGTWVFDDAKRKLDAEPFVMGIPEMINKMVRIAGIPNAKDGFRLIFSNQPFPGYQTKLDWVKKESGGNWYKNEDGNEGWLCSALFKFYSKAPLNLYGRAEALHQDDQKKYQK
jgi:hypothetical protein